MGVSTMISEAWQAVKDAGVPEALHEVAFKEAMAVLSAGGSTPAPKGGPAGGAAAGAKTPKAKQPAKPRTKKAAAQSEEDEPIGASLTEDEFFAKFAEETGIAAEELQEVFFLSDGKPILNGTTRKLGDNIAAQSRTVAVAITAAYHYALGVRDVPAAKVTAECKRKNCYDMDNFSTVMNREKGISFVGERGKKVFRVKSGDTTIDALKAVVNAFRGVKTPAAGA